eukprot:3489095-Pleurochrysis_carterae.AAC.1
MAQPTNKRITSARKYGYLMDTYTVDQTLPCRKNKYRLTIPKTAETDIKSSNVRQCKSSS